MAAQISDQPELQKVFATSDPVEARMAWALLRSADVNAFIFDEESSRMLGNTPAVAIRVMVPEDEAEEARRLLQEANFEL